MTKTEIINRVNQIAEIANSKDNGYSYEADIREWNNYDKSRTYFKIIETRENSKHRVVREYGYWDNNSDEFVAGRASLDYDFGGNNLIPWTTDEAEESTENENTEEETTMTVNNTCKQFNTISDLHTWLNEFEEKRGAALGLNEIETMLMPRASDEDIIAALRAEGYDPANLTADGHGYQLGDHTNNGWEYADEIDPNIIPTCEIRQREAC